MKYLSPTEPFFITLKLAVSVRFVLASPTVMRSVAHPPASGLGASDRMLSEWPGMTIHWNRVVSPGFNA
jgi:Sec-independent protein secretion pathway component TatC